MNTGKETKLSERIFSATAESGSMASYAYISAMTCMKSTIFLRVRFREAKGASILIYFDIIIGNWSTGTLSLQVLASCLLY